MPLIPLKTKRWDDPIDPDDGTRILITRYRPRGLKKELETWHIWDKDLAPSPELLAAFHGKHGITIGWELYRRRYTQEMRAQTEKIAALAARLNAGESITLLCSSACTRESHCHRTILAELINAMLARTSPQF